MDEFLDLSPELINQNLSSNFDGEKNEFLDWQGQKPNEKIISMRDSVRRASFKITNTTTSQKKLVLNTAAYATEMGLLVYDASGTLKVKVTGGGAVAVTNFGTGYVANDIVSTKQGVRDINLAGHNIDCVFDDGIIYAETADPTKYVMVNAISKNASAKHFNNFLKNFPTAFIGLHIVSDKPEFFESEMVLQECNPFKGAGSETRVPFGDDFTDQSTNVTKIIVHAGFQLDGNTLAQIVLPASSVITLTMVASVIHNGANALKKAVEKAVVGGKKLSGGGKKLR